MCTLGQGPSTPSHPAIPALRLTHMCCRHSWGRGGWPSLASTQQGPGREEPSVQTSVWSMGWGSRPPLPPHPRSDPTGIPGAPRSCLCRKNVSSHLSGQNLKFMSWNSLGSEEAGKAGTRGFKLKIQRRAENSIYSKKKRGPTKGSELGCWGAVSGLGLCRVLAG